MFLSAASMICLNFPKAKVFDGCRLIHSPEQWASGAGLMAGISAFDLRDVRGPTCYGKECMVQFDAVGQRFRLIGKQKSTCTLQVLSTDADMPHTTVVARVVPLLTGFRLVLYIEGEDDDLLEEYRSALEIGLWPCVHARPVTQDPALVLYREKLGICPINT